MRFLKSIWNFMQECLEALAQDDAPKQLSFDFEKEKRRWHDYLVRPPN